TRELILSLRCAPIGRNFTPAPPTRPGPSCGRPDKPPEQQDWVKVQSAKSSKVARIQPALTSALATRRALQQLDARELADVDLNDAERRCAARHGGGLFDTSPRSPARLGAPRQRRADPDLNALSFEPDSGLLAAGQTPGIPRMPAAKPAHYAARLY